jgi:hypothetical protein
MTQGLFYVLLIHTISGPDTQGILSGMRGVSTLPLEFKGPSTQTKSAKNSAIQQLFRKYLRHYQATVRRAGKNSK